MIRSRWMALLAVTPLALTACGPDEGEAPSLNDGPVKRAFENASIAEGVPEDLLLALGWVETHWTHELDVHEIEEGEEDDGHDQGLYGIMQLGARGETNTLLMASELLEQPVETIRTDLAWNVHGAAAVLRRYADEMYEGLDVEKLDLFAWRDVVAVWTGIDDLDVAYKVAEEVFAVMRDGVGMTLLSGENLELFPNPGLGAPDDGDLGQTQDGLVGVAGVRFYAAHSDHFGGTNKPTHIVIHTMQGSYAGSQSWARKSSAQRKKESGVASQSSAQYYLKSSNGEVTQMVSEDQAAYHARGWNSKSIGLEHEGWVNQPSWYTDAMYRSSARIVCDMAARWDIKLDREHVISHQQIDPARRTDPGPHWDWTYYMSLLEACSGGSTTPTNPSNPTNPTNPPVQPGTGLIQGMVYTGGNASNRVAGASIRLNNGQTATSDSNGYWSLRVAPGNHTVTATKAGYQASSVTRTVTTNGSVWASTNLTQAPVNTTGRVTGVVHDSADTSKRIAGAAVKVAGHSVTTDANGRYSVEVNAGTAAIEASASGYVTKSASATVRGGQTSTVNIALVKNQPASTGAGAIQGVIYEAPDESKRLAGAQVTITGGSKTFSVTTGGNGYFEVKDVPAGTWRVSASAPNYGAGSKSVTVTTNGKPWGSIGLRKLAVGSGQGTLTGVIYESPTTSRRLKGAEVSLSSGVSVTTDGNGVYTVGAAGAVTAIAEYPGFAPRAVTRTVPAGRTVWGSIGLVKGGANSDIVGSDCVPTSPKVPGGHFPPYSVMLISPVDGERVEPSPTFEFTGVGDPTAKYRLVLVKADNMNNPNEEFDAGYADANNKITFKLPKQLEENIWIWSGYARWDDCDTTKAVSWGFFSTYKK